MKIPVRAGIRVAAGFWLFLSAEASAQTQSRLPIPGVARTEALVTNHASGTFEVRLTPQTMSDSAAGPTLGRMSIDKQFHGDLEGTSNGEMLTGGTVASGSGGYVAMELVSGILQGRHGSFVLQHSGTMTPSSQQLTISVVPGSGTGHLMGLAGTMKITIADGKHSYDFEYSLP